MKFTVAAFFNETSRFEPYSKGDKLKVSEMSFIDIEAERPQDAAGKMFARMNADNRPNGRTERSLSVGDVVVVEWREDGRPWLTQRRYAVDPIGFREV